MNIFMALTTDDQCLASSDCHLFGPCRFFFPPWLLKICQFADVMNLYLLSRSAEFALIRQNSFEEFAPVRHEKLGSMINQDGVLLSFKGDPSELSY